MAIPLSHPSHLQSVPHPVSPSSLSAPAPKLTPEQLLLPTSTLYAANLPPKGPHDSFHFGPYKRERLELDWSYHKVPTKERQALQDEIVDQVLQRVVKECEEGQNARDCGSGEVCTRRREKGELGVEDNRPLALFTAGGMGAGKGHTLKEFLRDGTIILPSNFIWVDPDSLARSLPEREQYLQSNPSMASKLLHPEASMLQEILSNVARNQKRSLVIDGSLTDCGWYKGTMKKYEDEGYGIEILFVYADEETMLDRAKRRAVTTGRVTNPESIKSSRIRSPECVTSLAKVDHVDRVRLVDNASDNGPSSIVYDSDLDVGWKKPHGGYRVDVLGFVEGKLMQTEEGGVKRKSMM